MNNFWNDKWTNNYGAFHKKYFIALGLLKTDDITKTILDIGSGNGNLFDLLLQNGFQKNNLYASDISTKALEICKEKGYNTLSQTNRIDINFDIITMIDVLEHIENPEHFLTELTQHTNELIIVVPNFNSYKQRIEVLQGKIPFQNKIQRGGHILWVNHHFLLNLFEKCNLSIVDTYHLFSKTNDKKSLSYKVQNIFPNLFANSFGYRVEKLI